MKRPTAVWLSLAICLAMDAQAFGASNPSCPSNVFEEQALAHRLCSVNPVYVEHSSVELIKLRAKLYRLLFKNVFVPGPRAPLWVPPAYAANRFYPVLEKELAAARQEVALREAQELPHVRRDLKEPIPPGERVLGIGDLHGELRGLLVILLSLGIIEPIEGHRIGQDWTVIQVGDVINRYRYRLARLESSETYFSKKADAYLDRLLTEAGLLGPGPFGRRQLGLLGNHELSPLHYGTGGDTFGPYIGQYRPVLLERILQGTLQAAAFVGGLIFSHSVALPRHEHPPATQLVYDANRALLDAARQAKDTQHYFQFLLPGGIFDEQTGLFTWYPNKGFDWNRLVYDQVVGHLRSLIADQIRWLNKALVIDAGLAAQRQFVVLEGSQIKGYKLAPRTLLTSQA